MRKMRNTPNTSDMNFEIRLIVGKLILEIKLEEFEKGCSHFKIHGGKTRINENELRKKKKKKTGKSFQFSILQGKGYRRPG